MESPLAVSLRGRHCWARAVQNSDLDWIHELLTSEDLLQRYRHHGFVPLPSASVNLAFRDAAVSVVFLSGSQDERIGIGSIYNVDGLNGHGFLAVAVASKYQLRGVGIDAAIILVRYAIAALGLRKVYLELVSDSGTRIKSAIGSILLEEARLRDHDFCDGRYRDRVVLSIDRSALELIQGYLGGSPPP